MDDKDLHFLNNCSNEQLIMLADIITDKAHGYRATESLSTNKLYHTCYPNKMQLLVPAIIDEFQCFGGNTIANIFRGHGVPYIEILEDVCDKLKVNYNKGLPTETIERYLIQKFLLTSIDKMNDEDARHISDLNKTQLKDKLKYLEVGSPLYIRLVTLLVMKIAEKQGFKLLLEVGEKFIGSKFFTIFAGPIGWAITGVWTAFDIAGPAYRVTVPCTITTAYLRIIQDKTENELKDILS